MRSNNIFAKDMIGVLLRSEKDLSLSGSLAGTMQNSNIKISFVYNMSKKTPMHIEGVETWLQSNS